MFIVHSYLIKNVHSYLDNYISDQVKRLVELLAGETLSARELMERLNLNHRPTFRKNYLNPALDEELIERTIPDKLNSPK